jgi:hypothetical protein
LEEHPEVKTSKWLSSLAREAKQKPVNESKVSERMARLAHLFEDSSDDDNNDLKAEDKLDQMAANENLDKFFKKVDNHLQIEKVIIDDM